jgi:hypothetical protein
MGGRAADDAAADHGDVGGFEAVRAGHKAL